jgi:DNA-binding HxlR family transcriptional regulator
MWFNQQIMCALESKAPQRHARLPQPGKAARGSASGRPIMALLDLLGRRWALRIVWELRARPLTFRELLDLLGANSGALNTRIRELRHAAIVEHTPGEGYGLTAEGQRLIGSLAPLQRWAERWAKRQHRSQASVTADQ